MSQEATMIALDNSSYMRNGDFIPDRFVAQREAVHFICNSLKRQNVENTCGLITLSNCQVLCALTLDTTKVCSQVNQVSPDGEISFCTTISIAHLVLRNRQFRNQKPKVLIFIGSPVEDEDEELLKIARKLKKEKVTVIIINFGEAEHNQIKLEGFINTINGKDVSSSKIITIPPGHGIMEFLRSNPTIIGELNSERPNDFTLDPMEDPDLAYALRVSLEDQRMRSDQNTASPKSIPQPNQQTITNEEAQLNQSVLAATAAHSNGGRDHENSFDLHGMTEEEQIQYAIGISLAAQQQESAESGEVKDENKKHRESIEKKRKSRKRK